MRILGIDPGSTATGYGIVERRDGRICHVAHGTLRPTRSDPLPARLATLHRTIGEVIALHRPDFVAVERIFVSASPRSALVLGEARGVVLAAAAAAGLTVCEYAAREIKQAVVGTGVAEKRQVQLMVRRLLDLDRVPASDAADALAAAICRAHIGVLDGLGRRGSRRRRPQSRGFVVRRRR
jgi:crossover junction endodeoxyribonuclease RuvC